MSIQHVSISEAANSDVGGDALTSLQRWGIDFARQYDLHMLLQASASGSAKAPVELKAVGVRRGSIANERLFKSDY